MPYHYNGEMNRGSGGYYSLGTQIVQGTLTYYEDGGPGGTFYWRYKGQFTKGKATGQGTTSYGEQWPDDDCRYWVYHGAHDNEFAHGHGTWYYPSKAMAYFGNHQEGKYHGEGTSYRDDGAIMEGDTREDGTRMYDVRADKDHWETTYSGDTREDGTREYEGEWRADYWQGRGTLFCLDGITPAREGDCDWRKGSSQSYEDGSRYEGEWDDNGKQKHGWGILYDPNLKIVYKGWWQNDKPSEVPPPGYPV